MLIVPLTTYGDIGGFARIYRAGVVDLHRRVDRLRDRAQPDRCSSRRAACKASARPAILATSQPITRFAFPRTMLGMAIGIQSLIVSISSAAGPSIGGLILGLGSWPWLFWINVPFALVALALSGMLPDMPRATHRFDWLSAVFSGATLALFITGLDQLRAPANTVFFALEIAGALILGHDRRAPASAARDAVHRDRPVADPHHPALADDVVHRVHRRRTRR